MKLLNAIALFLFLALNIYSQEDKIRKLIAQGTQLHDKGKYEEAIIRYKTALDIDKNSSLANYELSYTYMTMQKYDEAIKYSKRVLELNGGQQEHAYLVLGNSLDMTGKPKEAISVYEEGLMKFPQSNLLNYNIAFTAYNLGDYEKAEHSAINAIQINPTHASSHLILASIMQEKGERVKAILPLYYFLFLEPNSKRSLTIYRILRTLLSQGIEKKSDKEVNVEVPSSAIKDSIFGPAEMMLGILGANKYLEENIEKSEFEVFVQTNKSLFSVLSEIKKDNKGIWWDLYVTAFQSLVHSGNCEAFSYYISQSTNSDDVKSWMANNPTKMELLQDWLKK
jgi:tetratricopeptide (TPR) repeat protein